MKKIPWFGFGIIFIMIFIVHALSAFAYNGVVWDYSVNPCLGQTWENGTDLTISILAKACPDNSKNYPSSNCSQVTAKASIYVGDSNIQTDTTYWGNYYASGTTFTFDSWAVNKTGTYTIRLQTKSNDMADTGDIVDMTFNVAVSPVVVNGTSILYVVYGDCVSEGSALGGTNITGTDAITTIMDDAKSHGFGYTVVWLVIMLVVAGLIWIGAAEYGMISVAMIAFSEIILLFIGVYLGFISWLIVLFIGLIASAIVGKKIYDLFKG